MVEDSLEIRNDFGYEMEFMYLFEWHYAKHREEINRLLVEVV